MIQRVETNLYKDGAIAEIATSADVANSTANVALDRSYEYGVCQTASNTPNKVATIANFPELYVGANATITFTYRNTADNPTLNVNNTGAIPIYARGSGLVGTSGYNWENGSTVEFIYDGSSWVMMPRSMQESVNVLAGSNANSRTQVMYTDGGRVYINADHIVTGTLDASLARITNIDAASITVGKLTGSQIEGDTITAYNIAGGTITGDEIQANSISVGELTGKITNGKWVINLDTGQFTIGDISANNITTGTLDADKVTINNLEVGDINGTLGNSKSGVYIDFDNGTVSLKDISASVITTGTLDANKVTINNLEAADIKAGTFSADRIPNLDASKITSGYINANRIQADSINVSKLGGSISNGTWKIDFDNESLTIGNISADNIITGTLSGNRISGGTISGTSISSSGTYGTTTISSGRIQNTEYYPNASYYTRASIYGGEFLVDDNMIGGHTVLGAGSLSVTKGTSIQIIPPSILSGGADVTPWARKGASYKERFTGGVYSGFYSSSLGRFDFFVPSPKNMSLISSATVAVSGNLYARTVNGGMTIDPTNFTKSVDLVANGYRVIMKGTMPRTVTTDTPISVTHSSGTGYVEFTLS